MNVSCQSAGHYLEESDVSVAALAAVVATAKLRAMNNTDEAHQIITKIVKQYLASKKEFSSTRYGILAQYATGGVPQELSARNLIEMFKGSQATVKTKHSFMNISKTLRTADFKTPKLTGALAKQDEEAEDNYTSEGEEEIFEDMTKSFSEVLGDDISKRWANADGTPATDDLEFPVLNLEGLDQADRSRNKAFID